MSERASEIMSAFPSTAYDAWKTTPPDDDAGPDPEDDRDPDRAHDAVDEDDVREDARWEAKVAARLAVGRRTKTAAAVRAAGRSSAT